MKSLKYILGLALPALMVLPACQDSFDEPGLQDAPATWESNWTIAQLKEKYWEDDLNYIDTIGYIYNDVTEYGEDAGNVVRYPLDANGKRKQYEGRIYIKGRVCSSDKDGNVFRKFVIQDGTAALAISVYQYNTYLMYRMGQEVVIDATGMYIGKYAGGVQLGWPAKYLDAMQASFMPTPFLEAHIQTSGVPDMAKVDTLQIDNFSELGTNPQDLIRLQSRLVKFNNVAFKTPGQTLSTYHENGDQYIVDANGSDIVSVRTSGYSTFWNMITPSERGDVVGILDYYDTGSSSSTKWQLLLIDANGIMNFGNPTMPKGTRDNPFGVLDVVGRVNSSQSGKGWMMGYIVGAVAPGVDDEYPVSSNDDIEWGAQATLANTLVIAPTPDVKDWQSCVVVELPQGSKLRQWGNLRDNPENLGREIFITGTFAKVFGMAGLTGNRGTVDEFEIIGFVAPAEVEADFNTFNNGSPNGSKYNTYTSASGWTLTNGLVLAGSNDGTNANPNFAFIGGSKTLAPTLNGKAATPGRLVSPALTGGIKTLNFNYGFAFSDTQCQFTVNILQGGAVVRTKTVKVEQVTQFEAYTFTMDVNISGDFTIEIVNDCLGAASGNKERVSIWNLSWLQ